MTRNRAQRQARESFQGIPLAVVDEGPHADDHAERDSDGKSYGFCPVESVPTLYRYGEVVEVVR